MLFPADYGRLVCGGPHAGAGERSVPLGVAACSGSSWVAGSSRPHGLGSLPVSGSRSLASGVRAQPIPDHSLGSCPPFPVPPPCQWRALGAVLSRFASPLRSRLSSAGRLPSGDSRRRPRHSRAGAGAAAAAVAAAAAAAAAATAAMAAAATGAGRRSCRGAARRRGGALPRDWAPAVRPPRSSPRLRRDAFLPARRPSPRPPRLPRRLRSVRTGMPSAPVWPR